MDRTSAFLLGAITGALGLYAILYAVFGEDFTYLTSDQWKEIQASGILEHKSELKIL